jgi:hypothetical protein
MLVFAASVVSNIPCPECGLPYFTPGAIKHRPLKAKIPIRRGHCCNCSHNVFKVSDGKQNRTSVTFNSTSTVRGSEDS